MNLGEKIRLIHDSVEGVVVAFLGNNMIEIETPDGFRMQVLQREAVRVSASEELYFSTPKPDKIVLSKPLGVSSVEKVAVSESGLYLAFTAANSQTYNMNLVNYSEWDALVLVAEEFSHAHSVLFVGSINRGKFHKITETSLNNLDKKAALVFQILLHREGLFKIQEPLQKGFDFGTANFKANLKVAPILRKEAFLFELLSYAPELVKVHNIVANTTASSQIDAQKLKEKMMAGSKAEPLKQFVKKTIQSPPAEVDLHIECLVAESTKLSNAEIIQIQLNAFLSNLDAAMASGMPQITFIHGVGNGVLRTEIQKRLSKHPQIKFFQDAKREKFGYGATVIHFA